MEITTDIRVIIEDATPEEQTLFEQILLNAGIPEKAKQLEIACSRVQALIIVEALTRVVGNLKVCADFHGAQPM